MTSLGVYLEEGDYPRSLSVEKVKEELIAAGVKIHEDMPAPAWEIDGRIAMAYSVKIPEGSIEKSFVEWILKEKGDPKNFAFYRYDHIFKGREIFRFAVW